MTAANKEELVDMIQHGAEKIINESESMDVQDDIDAIIERGEARTAELNSKYAALSFDDLQVFKSEAGAATNWEGEEYGGKKKIGLTWIEPSKRERKSNYSIDEYYRGAMNKPGRGGPRAPRTRKSASANDYQFFLPRLSELQDKEAYYLKVCALCRTLSTTTRRTDSSMLLDSEQKQQEFVVPLREDPTMSAEDLEAERAAEQEAVDTGAYRIQPDLTSACRRY